MKLKTHLGGLFFLIILFFNTSIQAATIPEINYSKKSSRSLIFVNNPEQITSSDLGDWDYNSAAILQTGRLKGKYRNFFEHVNKTGFTIGYAIQLYNPNPYPITVKVTGSGYTPTVYGGKPFSQMFGEDSENTKNYQVDAQNSIWLMKQDNTIKNNSFFSGVIDFEIIDGEAIINNIAYRKFDNLPDSYDYIGYVQRIEPDGTHEARMYKGITSYSEVTANNIDFVINNTDKPGVLKVKHPVYNLTTNNYSPPKLKENGWYSNIGPASNSEATTKDMVPFYIPDWGGIYPKSSSDGEEKYPNLGNWGIIYRIKGTVTNYSNYSRRLSVNLKAPNNSNVFLAYQGNDGVWRDLQVKPGQNIQYYTFNVAVGQTISYSAAYVLGGPSGGNILQSISLNN